jgi:hypothetical protein
MAKKQNNPDFSPKASNLIAKWKEIINSQNEESTETKSEPNVYPAVNLNIKKEVKTEETPELRKMNMTDYKDKSEKQSNHISKVKNEPVETNARLKLPTVLVKNEPVSKNEPQPSVQTNSRPSSQADDFVPPLPTVSLDSLLNLNELNPSSNRKAQTITIAPPPMANSAFTSEYNPVNIKESKKSAMLSDSEALSKIFASKHSARTLYTGRKNIDPANNIVPKLGDLCTRTLMETIDDFPTRVYEYSKLELFFLEIQFLSY